MSRYLLTYSRNAELRYVGHLDFARFWERCFRRAGILLAHSNGYNPRPKIAFAAPLPVGMTAVADLLDVTLRDDLAPDVLAGRVGPQLPCGIVLRGAEPLAGAALMARLRHATYRAELIEHVDRDRLDTSIRLLLSNSTLSRERQHGGTTRTYDLRPLVVDLWLEANPAPVIAMRLIAGNGGTGRPEEVLAALGLADVLTSIERSSMGLASVQ